ERYNEAIDFLEKMPEEIVVHNEKTGTLCLVYILKKDKNKADEFFSELYQEAQNPGAFQAHSYLYMAYASMGKTEDAFAWLDKALKMKSSVLMLNYTDPLTNNLKSDARYRKYKSMLFFETENLEMQLNEKPPILNEETADIYTETLNRFIAEEEPFLIPNLSLRSLAEQVEIHPNKLSWLLNERMGKNFNEFINFYRIEYFKKLALDSGNRHISLIGLAYESGFNSKTVFNTYFKKETGMTPKEFLKQNGSAL
ncbi:MAG: helix-turn-helix transcriptional regulator, partial [Prolixibacteraceae bacterium]|nr:helix-turn-helix transcriptional regulator [Prolixibacteraceae bacterium]